MLPALIVHFSTNSNKILVLDIDRKIPFDMPRKLCGWYARRKSDTENTKHMKCTWSKQDTGVPSGSAAEIVWVAGNV